MAHFAELNEYNTVLRVIVVHNNELLDENSNESEQKGIQFCKDHYGQDTKWIQTSYNGNFRNCYAGTGYWYDEVKDIFVPKKPYLSWILNEETNRWEPPIPIPDTTRIYYWNEEILNWQEIKQPTET